MPRGWGLVVFVVFSLPLIKAKHFSPPESFSWTDVSLGEDFTFPFVSDKKGYLFNHGQGDAPLIDHGFKKKKLTEKSSTGCALLKIRDWYQNAPSSFCPPEVMKPILLYSEIHSGTSLLTFSLSHLVPSVVAIHELFCCDSCTNRSTAIRLYPKLLCSLNLPKIGVNKVMIGLPRQQFWAASRGYEFPIKYQIPVLFLIRENTLSRYLSSPGFRETRARVKRELESIVVKRLVWEVKQVRNNFLTLYCRLKKAGAEVMITSYEKLTTNYSQTMREITTFIGAEGEGPWWEEREREKEEEEGFRRGEHVPILEKIKNVKQVRSYLRKNYPEYECLLDENCVFPPFDCSSFHTHPPRKKIPFKK